MADTPISCIRLIPYRQFTDGTWGSILVINWLSATPSVFLFDSPERKKDAPNSARNHLLPMEEKMYARYVSAIDTADSSISGIAKETYGQYGLAPLAGRLVSAHIADMICENLNAHDTRTRREVNRENHIISEAKTQYTTTILEKELQAHSAPNASWERGILEQALPLITAGYAHSEWVQELLTLLHTRSCRTIEEKGIRAVLEANICKSKSDWGAVFKLLAERKVVARTSYLAGSQIINRVCEKEVTTASAIKQSPALVIIGGTIDKGWTDKIHNRQSSNLLIHYRDIAEIFVSNCK